MVDPGLNSGEGPSDRFFFGDILRVVSFFLVVCAALYYTLYCSCLFICLTM